MALPKLLQKLFQNGGAGDKLRPDILPEIDVGVTEVNGDSGVVTVKKLILGDHVLELQEDGSLKLDENLVITSAGGQIEGKIVLNNSQPIAASRDDMRVLIAGGTGWDKGAHLILSGKDATERTPGSFEIVAYDGANENRLEAFPNGNLTWGGHIIERHSARGATYIRYDSGLQICFGYVTVGANHENNTVTFPAPFKDASYGVSAAINTTVSDHRVSFGNATTTSIQFYKARADGNKYSMSINYIVVGWW